MSPRKPRAVWCEIDADGSLILAWETRRCALGFARKRRPGVRVVRYVPSSGAVARAEARVLRAAEAWHRYGGEAELAAAVDALRAARGKR